MFFSSILKITNRKGKAIQLSSCLKRKVSSIKGKEENRKFQFQIYAYLKRIAETDKTMKTRNKINTANIFVKVLFQEDLMLY